MSTQQGILFKNEDPSLQGVRIGSTNRGSGSKSPVFRQTQITDAGRNNSKGQIQIPPIDGFVAQHESSASMAKLFRKRKQEQSNKVSYFGSQFTGFGRNQQTSKLPEIIPQQVTFPTNDGASQLQTITDEKNQSTKQKTLMDGDKTEKSEGNDIKKETLTKLNLALLKRKEKAILAAKKKKKKLNMEAELKEFRKQEKEKNQIEKGKKLFMDRLQSEEAKVIQGLVDYGKEQNIRLQSSLDRIHEEKRRKQSWEWSVNNVDRPIINDEKNIRNFIYSSRQIEDLEKSDPFYINNLLEKLKYSCQIDELQQQYTLRKINRNSDWYLGMFNHIEQVVDDKLNMIRENIIQNTLHLIPDLNQQLSESEPFTVKKSYGNNLIKCEIEVVKKKKSNYVSQFREVGLTVHIQEFSSYILIVFWRNTQSSHIYPAIRPQFGCYELFLYSLPEHNYSMKKKFTLQPLPIIQSKSGDLYVQIHIPHLPLLQLKKQLSVQSREQGDYIQDVQIYDTKERVAFKLHSQVPFALGLLSHAQFPYRIWTLKMNKNNHVEFSVQTQQTTVEIYFSDVVKVNFQFGQKAETFNEYQNTPEALIALQEAGINLIPTIDDLEVFGCNLNTENEIQAALDISYMIQFFQFRSTASTINGRSIELEILEDTLGELNYLNDDQKRQIKYHRVKWFNCKVKVAQIDENTFNYKYYAKNEQNLTADDFLKKYRKYISYPKLIDALESLEIKPKVCQYIKLQQEKGEQNELQNENLYQFLLTSKILTLTGKTGKQT